MALFYFRERSNNLPVLFSCPGSGSSGIMMCILCIFPTFFCFLFFTFVPRFRQPRFRSLRPHLKNLCGDLPLHASHIHTIVQSRASLRARPGPIPHCLRPTCIVGSEVIRQPEGSTHRYTAWANSLTQVPRPLPCDGPSGDAEGQPRVCRADVSFAPRRDSSGHRDRWLVPTLGGFPQAQLYLHRYRDRTVAEESPPILYPGAGS